MNEGSDVLLVFCHDTELGLLRVLKAGFRHVFVAKRQRGGWITIDPLASRMEVEFHPLEPEADMVGWFLSRGHTVASLRVVPRQPARPRMPIMPLTCVSVAKQVLGIRAPLVQTPWQLFRHVTERGAQAPTIRQGVRHGAR